MAEPTPAPRGATLFGVLGAAAGFLGVAAGAFGAHALRDSLPPERLQLVLSQFPSRLLPGVPRAGL